jgi:hypothetical protein
MSHVSGPLQWNTAIFRGARKEASKLILELADGTVRVMNYQNWHETIQTTEKKAFSLKPGTPIRVATWAAYDSNKWFCDVEEIVDPTPPLVGELSDLWSVKRSTGAKQFDKAFIRLIECSISSPRLIYLSGNAHLRWGYVVTLDPLDQFFSKYTARLSGFSDSINFDVSDQPFRSVLRDFDRISKDIQEQWKSLELREFMKYLENELLRDAGKSALPATQGQDQRLPR